MKKLSTLLVLSITPFLGVLVQTGMGIGTNSPLEKLHVTGGIKIGTDINNGAGAPAGGAGTIRYKAGAYEGWDGSQWVGLGGGSGADAD